MLASFSHGSTMELVGKIVLVTGAGRGIGKALAIGFAKAGAHVVVVSRTLTEIEATALEVQGAGAQALVINADISDPHDVRRIADQVGNRFGRLDVLVNNAAVRMNQLGKKDSYYIPFVDLSLDDWDTAMNVNLRGHFCVSKNACRSCETTPKAASSISPPVAEKEEWPGRVPYCASKFGLEALTQCLALEFQAYNIAVNSLSPGKHSILTDQEKLGQLKENPDLIFMRPEMMVPPALFLASQNSQGTTGQHIEAFQWVSQNNYGGIEDWRVRI